MSKKHNIYVKSIESLEYDTMKRMTHTMRRYIYIDVIDMGKIKVDLSTDSDKQKMNETMRSEDYVKATISINDQEYLVYHGFPGGNAAGVLVNPETKNIMTAFGEVAYTKDKVYEKEDKDTTEKFLQWYNENPDTISCDMLTVSKITDTPEDEEIEGTEEDDEEEDEEEEVEE